LIIFYTKELDPKYKLVREHDNLTKSANEVTWVEWNEDGTFKQKYDEPAVGRSLLMSPFNQFFTWQTTEITEILETRENFVKFKTKNSTYVLEHKT
jgi:glutamate 5-kinase